jgi:hypothetical protein
MRIFHPGESARIGAHPYNKRLCGLECKVTRDVAPVMGMPRYIVEFDDGWREIFLEATLMKKFERGDWSGCVWQPRRVR